MRTHPRLFRLTATTAIVGLALGPLLPQPGSAQSAPPPLAPPAASPTPPPQTTADPPARVGRLSRLAGQVSFHGIGADHWDDATLNFPVTSGDSFWTQPGASADIGVTNNRLTMDQSTELDIVTLDNNSFTATIPQGQVYLRLAALAPGETYTLTTPRGTVAITAPGHYEISAGDTQDPTRVTVLDGSAQVSGSNLNLQVTANQTVLITGTDPFQTQVVPAQRDAFLTAQVARERPPAPTGGITAPAEVAQMTGGEDLYEYGTWSQTPQYGTVWYPQAAAGFVPYRNGHWAYVAPWGWTWVDAAPWGFAPFHYGRWVQIGGRWGWAPGGGAVAYGAPGYVAPVYAPALVTFLGVAAGVAVGAAIGAAIGGNVGWCPLGWQEPYHPWYRASPAYVRNVNVVSVRNVTNITTINNTTINNFANRGAATMVPASAMVASRPIAQVARPIPPAQFAQARPVYGQEPIMPTAATVGVTPRVAQQMHLASPPPGAAPAMRPAPGPVIRAQATAPAERPPLQTNARPPAPGAATAPAAEAPHGPAAPGAATTEHAPGPPIEPRGTAAAPTATPGLRPPAEAAHPEPQAPAHAGTAPAHPGAAAQTETRPAPRATPPAEQPHPQAAAPQVHETPHPQAVAPQVHEAPHPQAAAPQVHEVPHPQVAAPQVHEAPPRAAPAAHPQPHPPEKRGNQSRAQPQPAHQVSHAQPHAEHAPHHA